MAATTDSYNQTLKRFLNKEVDFTQMRLMLLSDSATFTASNTTLNQVTSSGAYQISGNGWPSGGVTLTGVAVTVVSTNMTQLTAANISVTATGGPIGTAYKAVIYDDSVSGDPPLFFTNLDGPKIAANGSDFKININALGLLRIGWTT